MIIKKCFFILCAVVAVNVSAQQNFKVNFLNICKEDRNKTNMVAYKCNDTKMELDIEVYRGEGVLYMGGKETGSKYLIDEEFTEELEDGTLLLVLTDDKNNKNYVGKVDFKNKMVGLLDGGGYIFLFGAKILKHDDYLFGMSEMLKTVFIL